MHCVCLESRVRLAQFCISANSELVQPALLDGNNNRHFVCNAGKFLLKNIYLVVTQDLCLLTIHWCSCLYYFSVAGRVHYIPISWTCIPSQGFVHAHTYFIWYPDFRTGLCYIVTWNHREAFICNQVSELIATES